jgi:hypothetical protein
MQMPLINQRTIPTSPSCCLRQRHVEFRKHFTEYSVALSEQNASLTECTSSLQQQLRY